MEDMEGIGEIDDTIELLNRYFAMWNTTDPASRHALVARIWTDDAQYVDPRARALGREQIEEMVSEVRRTAPHLSFRRVGDTLMHNEFVWYAWEMSGADGTAIGGGVSFAEIADGRLHRLVGFFHDAAPTHTRALFSSAAVNGR